MTKQTQRIIKKHFRYCLRYKMFRATIFVKDEEAKEKIIPLLKQYYEHYSSHILQVEYGKNKYCIKFLNGSYLCVLTEANFNALGYRTNSVIIDKQISKSFRQVYIFTTLIRRLIFVPYWWERFVKIIDSKKHYPHISECKNLDKYIDYIDI